MLLTKETAEYENGINYIDKTEFSFSVKDGFPIGVIFEDVIDIEIELSNSNPL